MFEEFIWVEKYRPHTIADTILPKDLKAAFSSMVKAGNIQNMTLAGGPGVGKTTVAKALCDELDCDYIVINASKDRNIDTLRNEIEVFASSVSFKGGRKYVILDEADHLNPTSTQPALRNFIEEYSHNCGFILTVNYPSKLIPALISRCPIIDFAIRKSEMPALAMAFFKRMKTVLESENVEYDQATLAKVIEKWFPDWRRTIGELQKYAAINGKIDTGILVNLESIALDELIGFMKKKEYSNVRKWVAENSDTIGIYRKFYDTAVDVFDKRFIPAAVLILAKYQYQAAFAVDPEINLAACLAEIMIDAQWRE